MVTAADFIAAIPDCASVPRRICHHDATQPEKRTHVVQLKRNIIACKFGKSGNLVSIPQQ